MCRDNFLLRSVNGTDYFFGVVATLGRCYGRGQMEEAKSADLFAEAKHNKYLAKEKGGRWHACTTDVVCTIDFALWKR